jgi:hypothetical protein
MLILDEIECSEKSSSSDEATENSLQRGLSEVKAVKKKQFA